MIVGSQYIVGFSVEDNRVVLVLRVDHCLKAVSEHGEVFEGIVDFENCLKWDEETSDQQERDDEYRNQGHHDSSIRENSREQKSES